MDPSGMPSRIAGRRRWRAGSGGRVHASRRCGRTSRRRDRSATEGSRPFSVPRGSAGAPCASSSGCLRQPSHWSVQGSRPGWAAGSVSRRGRCAGGSEARDPSGRGTTKRLREGRGWGVGWCATQSATAPGSPASRVRARSPTGLCRSAFLGSESSSRMKGAISASVPWRSFPALRHADRVRQPDSAGWRERHGSGRDAAHDAKVGFALTAAAPGRARRGGRRRRG